MEHVFFLFVFYFLAISWTPGDPQGHFLEMFLTFITDRPQNDHWTFLYILKEFLIFLYVAGHAHYKATVSPRQCHPKAMI